MASHCTCMAGLSQTCSHAAALLFLLFLHVEEENTPCTSKKCKWSETKVAKYSKISNVDFRSPSAKFLGKETGKVSHEIFDQPTEAEKKRFLQKLHLSCNDTGYKPVAFAVMKEFAEEYLPLLSSGLLPCLITDYYSPSYLSLSYNEVIVLAESITHSIKLSSEQCTMAERHTRSQADSKIWYRLRAGRVTGSRFKQACSTKVESPAISLIKAVCYPEAVKFSSKSTMYGRLNEKNGLRCFISVEEGKHSNFCVGASGLWFHPDFPQFAVSPDAVGKCSCHGKFSVEIKCPFRAENQKLSELVGTKSFFLDEVNGSIIRLKKDSPHYYQVQMQLAILEAEFCFFVVWSALELYIETIIRNKVFFDIMATKATRFWTNCILPETIAKTFTAATTHAVQHHPTMFLAPPEEEDDVIEVD